MQNLRSFQISLYLSAIFFSAVLLAGCAYSFTGASVPAHWKTIAVPLFDDDSGFGQPSLREDVTNVLMQKIQQDNTLQLADKESANVELRGAITSVIADQPSAVGQGTQASRLELSLKVRVTLIDHVQNKEVWSKDFTATGDYPASEGQAGRENGLQQAIENITDDLLLETVSAW
ncbi:MAG: LptE family protein [Bacteroidetes bacterium]|nr:LptE family protein [Bacteroidota bacterium]